MVSATIATGLPWISTFPSRNDADFSQIHCCLRDTRKTSGQAGERSSGKVPSLRLCCPLSGEDSGAVSSSRGSSQSHLHQLDPPQNLNYISNPDSISRVGSTASLPCSLDSTGGSTRHPTPLDSAAACGQPAMPTQCCRAEHEGNAL